jgi:hypothetical protein
MIDIIDELERGAMESREKGVEYIKTPPSDILLFIAEIRRLRRESKMLHQIVDDAIAMAAHRRTGLLGPEVVAHRKCPCGGSPVLMKPGAWINDYCVCCDNEECQMSTEYFDTPEEAWAAWDGDWRRK